MEKCVKYGRYLRCGRSGGRCPLNWDLRFEGGAMLGFFDAGCPLGAFEPLAKSLICRHAMKGGEGDERC